MEISKKTDYAIRMLAELVRNEGGIVSVRLAAEKNDVPYSFARSIQHDLVRAGVVDSIRGSHGGMKLAIDPRTTTVRVVIEAIQGPICVAEYADDCPPQDDLHGFRSLWLQANYLLRDLFDSVTLYEVVMEGRCPVLREGYQFEALTLEERTKLA